MIPYTAMQEYVRGAIDNYRKATEQDFNLVEYANSLIYSPEELLLTFGWQRIIAPSPIKNSIDGYIRRSFFSQEYEFRIDLHFTEDYAQELFAIDWFFDDGIIRFVRDDIYKLNDTFVCPVGSLTLYAILKYHGDIKNTIFYLCEQREYPETKKSHLRELAKITTNDRPHYLKPPAPKPLQISQPQNLSEESSDTIKKLQSDVKTLNLKIRTLEEATKFRTPVKQDTIEETYDADGKNISKYSQAQFSDLTGKESYLTDTGIPIGYYAGNDPFDNSSNSQSSNKIYDNSPIHAITFGPTGSGKLTSIQIPTLMEYKGSMVVIDPKGECAIISARQRKKLGQDVIIINPFAILKEDFKEVGITEFKGFNPLATLDPSDDNFVADVSALAESLVVRDDIGNSDPYWSDSARDLIACLIMYVCVCDDEKENKNLARVREILTSELKEFLVWMQKISKHSFLPMAQKAKRFLSSDKSNLSVISTAIANTLFIDDPKIADSLKSTDGFNFKQLKEKMVTVYIILPAKFLLAYNRWLRLLVTSALDTLMSTHEKPDKSVLFMLDEFAVLGRLSCIETAVGLARGYGIKLWMFLQDIHQLNYLYKDKAESFLSNTGVQQYFVPNDLTTAEKISKRMGNTYLNKENVTSISESIGLFPDLRHPIKIDISKAERPLLYPIEVMSLSKDKQIVFFSGNVSPVLINKNYYYENGKYVDDEGKPLYDKNPYFKG